MTYSKTQRGIAGLEIVVIIVVIAALAGAGAAIVHTYNRALTENADLKTKNETLTEANKDQAVENATLTAQQELLNQQTAARAATDQRLAALERKLNDALSKLYAQSPEARKWAATPIPDDVRRVVRQRANGGSGSDQDKAGAAPAAVVKPDTAAAVPRPGVYQRRPAGVRSATGVKPQ